jgi:hypothetical protein
MTDKARLFSVRLHEKFDVGKFDLACKELGTNKSRLVQEGLEVVINMSPKLRGKLTATAQLTNFPVWALIQSMVADWYGKHDAEVEVYGQAGASFLFQIDGQGKPVDGKLIYEAVRESHSRTLEREKLEQLKAKELSGVQLSDDEKAFMIQHRNGKTYYESPQYRKTAAKMQKLQKLKDEGKPGSSPDAEL